MFNVCPGCGEYSVEKAVDLEGPFAVCGRCGYRQPFLRLPLFVVTGASGAGKTAVALLLPALLPEYVVLETDVLWGAVPASGDAGLRFYWETWLRLVKNIHQGGRSVVLCGKGFPDQLEMCAERRYIGDIRVLALVCADEQLRARLLARPPWRGSHERGSIERMIAFNRWLIRSGETREAPIDLLRTDRHTPRETADRAARWVRRGLTPAG